MSKELEALNTIKNTLEDIQFYNRNVKIDNSIYDLFDTIENRLEAIDNANPSEALKTLEILDNTISPLLEPILAEYEDDLSDKITANYFALKQALLKAQVQEKVLEIINKKTVGIFQLKCCKNVDEYNDLKFNDNEKLTQEEFELLKRYFEKNIQNR